jgi:FMN phosphatase YigB (HAD superfamily)
MKPQFLYFDLGNVLLPFSHQRMAEQMGRVAGVPAQRAWQILFDDGLHWDYERGELTEDQFYTRFCELCGTSTDRTALDWAALDQAANDIFEVNISLIALIGHLAATGCPLGILSNTTSSHWRYCTSRYGVLGLFRVHALSFRLRAMKPDSQIYRAAAKLANTPPDRIFFTDDRPEHVAAARAAGWDAIAYESVSQVNEHLRGRGVVINY